MSAPRVLAQLKMVGPNIQFGDGSCLELFQHNGEVRAIVDEPGFRLQVDPALPAGHLYVQHRQSHDPPVREGMYYLGLVGIRWPGRWESDGDGPYTKASVSSFAKYMIFDYFAKTRLILNHFSETHQINETSITLNR